MPQVKLSVQIASELANLPTKAQFKKWAKAALRVDTEVTISETTWQSSIFPHSQSKVYILPVKADVRKKEKILVDNVVEVRLKIEV